ncbi:MAG: SIR2 family NAD-dependent protein deacylase [Mycobacteriales bacterium]
MESGAVTRVGEWIAASRQVTVLTGAGISTDSGIPDFRGPQGLWTRNPGAEKMSHLADYLADPEVRRRAWVSRRGHGAWTAEPNAGHRALVALERAGKLRAVVTQNVDGLHQRAGSDPDLVIEVHGTIHDSQCVECGDRVPMAATLERVAGGDPDPACLACGGILKSATISFGQALEADVLRAAVAAAADCEVFLAVGTSLQVYPVADLVRVAAGTGAKVVIVNAQPTPYDDMADAVFREPIGIILPELVETGVGRATGSDSAR